MNALREVVTSTRAMQICEELDLSDEYLMESTAVVVTHTRTWDLLRPCPVRHTH